MSLLWDFLSYKRQSHPMGFSQKFRDKNPEKISCDWKIPGFPDHPQRIPKLKKSHPKATSYINLVTWAGAMSTKRDTLLTWYNNLSKFAKSSLNISSRYNFDIFLNEVFSLEEWVYFILFALTASKDFREEISFSDYFWVANMNQAIYFASSREVLPF